MRKRLNDSGESTVNGQRSTAELWTVVCGLLTMILLFSCSGKDATQADTYTCPMHPTVVSDRHGTCPVCGMDLVRKARAGEEVEITEDLAKLLQSPDEAIISSVATIKGTYQLLPVSINVQGLVTYDTRYAYSIPARIGGRLEKVYVKSVFQPISKGQKIADIYSPELITAQRELIYLLANDSGNSTLIESAKEKLSLLGLSSQQLNDLIQRQEASTSFPIYSSYDGYVISESQPAPVASSSVMSGGMNLVSNRIVSQSSPAGNDDVLLRAGDYVNAGQTLFKVVNPSALRIELSLPATQANSIHVNDELDLTIEGKTEKAKVDFIQPFTEKGNELIRIRLYLQNRNDLRLGQFIQATIKSKPTEALWVPAAAVLDLGLKQVVFIKERGVFKPREIQTGTHTKGWIEVKGLTSSDEIASDAHYLVDSEDLIKTLN